MSPCPRRGPFWIYFGSILSNIGTVIADKNIMIRAFFRALGLAVLLVPPAWSALPASVDGQPLPSLAPVLEQVTPAVVNIHSRTRVRSPFADDPFFRRFFGAPRERVAQSLGSGVIVDAAQGYILTNNHVIEGAENVEVTLSDGRSFSADLIGTDPDTDLGLIQIPADQLTELELPAADNLRVGDFVVAVGNPFGLGQTVTSGIVSALGRRGLRGLDYQNFIQTDASINPGNSGGALINLRGELVGINTAIFSPSGGNVGIGFAIPAAIAAYVMEELITHGTVRRGRLGVSVQAVTPELARAFELRTSAGALVTEVRAGSAADAIGLREGDVIVSLGGQSVLDPESLRNAEGLVPVDQSVAIEYTRDGGRRTGTVTLESYTPREIDGGQLAGLLKGTRLRDLDARVAERSGISGVLLVEVQRGSRAWRTGLRAGDLIRRINRRDSGNLDRLTRLVEDDPDSLLLDVLRGRRRYLVVLE